KPELAAVIKQPLSHLVGLHAMDRLLDERVEVLDAQAETVEAELPQDATLLWSGRPWVHFDPYLGLIREGKALLDVTVEVGDLLGGKIGRRAAAPVQLLDPAGRINVGAHPVNLLLETGEVRNAHFVLFADHDVAAAEEAERLAEGEVKVKRERRWLRFGIRFS